ncbi:MAG: lipid droplet-associated protein [Rhodococcus sp.]|uniref:lipid droplet-associated protein n=1 Tax=Rhodococcus TaxID=1827 RepID=UPI00169C52BA|nr:MULTISPECIES: lipid droplet-associated protein [Rhodococcus]NLV80692.1 lipid droplet-associated protein [Rhodococcus sp. (in: high G+C Gram-positive bacteria)]
MIRPPFMARVAAGVAVTAYEETLKLPSTAVALPMTTVSQVLQTTMRMQQVLTELAIKGDGLFELLGAGPDEQPAWAVFDDDAPASTSATTATDSDGPAPARAPTAPADPAPAETAATGRFALYSTPPPASRDTAGAPSPSPADDAPAASVKAAPATKAPAKKAPGKKAPATKKTSPAKKTSSARKTAPTAKTPTKPGVTKTSPVAGAASTAEIVEYLDYDSLTLAQLRARLRTLSVDDLTVLLDHENAHAARAPFVTMLSNRIATAGRK